MRARSALSTGSATSAARRRHQLLENSWRRKPTIIVATPSEALRTELPTKPSQTTTSVVPLKMSSPSTLPWKLSPLPRSRSAACFTVSLPLMSSMPMLSRPTEGRSRCSTAATSMAPMTPNCISCSGVQSTFAPRSRT